jgi:signal transduction histidine kinase
VLAAALLAVGEFQIHSPDPHRIIADKPFSSAVWAVTAHALAWRRRFAWPVFAVVTLGITLEAVPAPDSGTLAGFVALCIVLYTVARVDGALERTVAATAIAVLSLLFHYSRDPQVSNAQESIQATYAVLLSCPLVARGLRARSTRTAALEAEVADHALRQQEAARAAATAERARITRELHDVVAHGVSVTIVQAMAAQGALADGKADDARRRLAAIEEAGRQALADMRRLVSIDHASDPDLTAAPQPGVEDLGRLVERLARTGTPADFGMVGTARHLPAGVDLALFRIGQEAITNAINHAPGAEVHVRIVYGDGVTEVEVTNAAPNGPGSGPGSGRGLVGMRERTALYGGTLEAEACDGGFRVHAALPTHGASS